MGVNGRRPFTEIFEVAQNELVREGASNQEDKYKGIVNQVYLNELPSLLPEEYIQKDAFLTLVSEYTTGTVTIGSGTVGVLGASTVWTSADTNKLIKISDFNRINRVTFSNSTLFTFNNSLTWVEASGASLNYHLFQDRYALASDFAYMVADEQEDPNVVGRYVSGTQLFLTPYNNDQFDRLFSGIIGDLYGYTVKWINETPYLLTLSAPSVADILSYKYIPQLTTLTEYTTGTVTFTNTTAVIAAGGPLWTANINTSANTYYIRNDADGTGSSSKWAKITTVLNDTALTLSAAFGFTSGASITYTISEVSKWPARFDDSILYKTCLIVDPDNAQYKKWEGLYQEAIGLDKTVEARRNHVRPLKQFFGMRKRYER